MTKLPEHVQHRLDELNKRLTTFQRKRMQANLEKIMHQMAEGHNLLPGTIDYELYVKDISCRYINRQYDILYIHLRSRQDRNVVPFQELLPKDFL